MKKGKSREALERRMDGYGRQASADLCVTRRGLRTGSAAAFAVAAAALAAPDTALASIIYSTASPDQFFSVARATCSICANNPTFRVDLDGDGNNDLGFFGGYPTNRRKYARISGSAQLAFGPVGRYAADAAIRIFSGQVVGPENNFRRSVSFPTADFGSLRATTDTFGFRFRAAGSSQDDYGWMRVAMGSILGEPFKVQALDWAYDNTGASIVAGDEGTGEGLVETPEPGTLGLFTGIGLLALGVAGRRELARRRQAAGK